MPFKMKYKNSSFPFKGESHDFVHKGWKVIRKDLDDGILGEANDDGTIYIDESVKPGSKKEKAVLKHEDVHMDDMASGDLAYTDTEVTWKGSKYDRKDGKVKYKGKWYDEGDHSLPWEKKAHNA